MTRRERLAGAAILGVVSFCALTPPRAALAQPTLSASASIIVFPKVMSDGSRDTLIELANSSNSQVSALCLYLDGDSGLQVNFDLFLSRQNSLRWTASQGLLCPDGGLQCSAAGGLIPPVPVGFRGALLCVEVDQSGATLAGNHLAAGSTILDLSSGDAAAYEAIGFSGLETLNDDETLCLGGAPNDDCPLGAEYTACPDQWILSHVADGAEDPVVGAGSSVSTVLTFVNCGQDFFTATTPGSIVQIEAFNEFEQRLTTSIAIGAPWREASLEEIDVILSLDALGTTYAHTNFRAISGGVVIVAREIRQTGEQSSVTASAAFDLAPVGFSASQNEIILPPR